MMSLLCLIDYQSLRTITWLYLASSSPFSTRRIWYALNNHQCTQNSSSSFTLYRPRLLLCVSRHSRVPWSCKMPKSVPKVESRHFHLSLMKWLIDWTAGFFSSFPFSSLSLLHHYGMQSRMWLRFCYRPLKNELTPYGGKLWSHWLSFVWRRASFVNSHTSGREPIKEHQSQTFKLQTQPCHLTGLPIRQTFEICIAPQAEIHAWPLTEITYRLSPPAFEGLADSVGRMKCRALKGCLVATTHC